MITLLKLSVLEGIRANLSDGERNLLFGCMHAHNELSALNRILLFSMNRAMNGELGEFAEATQTWTLLQLLAAKILEAWAYIQKHLRDDGAAQRIAGHMGADELLHLEWLRGYFGITQLKKSPLKLLRDKAAFHYAGLDFGSTIENLAEGEDSIYLAKHPANALYFLGSAIVFRTVFAMIADLDATNRDQPQYVRAQIGFNRAAEDARDANHHMNSLLYGLIKPLLEKAGGGQLVPKERIPITNVPAPETVILPPFIALGAD